MIVKTLLDTDLYKFTTSYAYIKLFPYAMGTFSFNDRNETQYTEDFLKALKTEIKNLSQLRFTEEELEYMTKNCRFLPRVYWEWLSSFRFDPNKIDIHLDEACHLHIEVTDLLYKVTLYEVPLLAIVSEIKNRFFGNVADMNEILCKLSEKIELSNQHQLRFSEFGTRRRFSIDVQETVIKKLNETAHYCTGTSNCNFAMKYGMKMMGTHPHEWFMFHGAQFGYKHANYMALENCVAIPVMSSSLSTSWLPVTESWELMRRPKPSFSAMPSTLQRHWIFRNTARTKYAALSESVPTLPMIPDSSLRTS